MAPGPVSTDALAWAYAECESLIRRGDRDRWLASLFAPAEARPHLQALYAFNHEIARVREIVSDPLPGEVRFQWWRDALEGEARGDVRAHPVAAAIIATIARFRLPRVAFTNLIEARTFDLYDDPMPTERDLEGYCGETSSMLIQLGSLILADGRDCGTADAAGHGGVAYAIAGLLRALPWHASRGQVYMPLDLLARHGASRDDILARRGTPAVRAALAEMRAVACRHLSAARGCMVNMPPIIIAAFLPLCLVEPYLQAMENRRYDPFGTVVEIAQWRRQWLLWRGARRGARGAPLAC
ncbi:MAG: squalene/phytoene synthase family protein [Methylobacteriaceae bacterium]|nr:squalene/phytoene synthase family protein [Methylobacteriaceae bacterium]MBV9243820.1 squalene/phytoene synthase family protein [Methylobacteriaceae bacterium]MBV9634716.1 squalene/phytoene synthase family protein [Methylobacteriaceae bacterium]MBV9702888.1 squalene/phytoene synthase family protein [Methylobacteriaceae bacterium]